MRAGLADAQGNIVNVIVCSPDADYTPPEGMTLVFGSNVAKGMHISEIESDA